MKKKNKTRDIIIVMALLTAFVAVILVVINAMSSKLNEDAQDVTSKREWTEISDNIRYMIESSDLNAEYIVSNKREVLFLIGSENYYGVMYASASKSLFIYEGTYSTTATTDEAKIKEAKQNLNSSAGYERYADNVIEFTVNNANSNGLFTDGTIDVSLNVNINGETTRSNFSVEIPQATE